MAEEWVSEVEMLSILAESAAAEEPVTRRYGWSAEETEAAKAGVDGAFVSAIWSPVEYGPTVEVYATPAVHDRLVARVQMIRRAVAR